MSSARLSSTSASKRSGPSSTMTSHSCSSPSDDAHSSKAGGAKVQDTCGLSTASSPRYSAEIVRGSKCSCTAPSVIGTLIVSAPARRTARAPPARTRMTTTATPVLRVLDIGVRGRGGSRCHGAEAADFEVHAPVELLALLPRVVAERRLGAEGHDLDRRLRHAQLDEELLDGVRAPLREHLVVDRRTLAVGVARDEHHPGVGAAHRRRLVLEHLRGGGTPTRALEVEVDVGLDGHFVAR